MDAVCEVWHLKVTCLEYRGIVITFKHLKSQSFHIEILIFQTEKFPRVKIQITI